jgi:hypothetical protein
MPVTGAESWTVLGDDGVVVVPVERYLAYLAALERSPNRVRAYATSLRLWFEFLGQADVGWADAGVEDVARFRLRAENTVLREQAARHLGEQRAAIHPIQAATPTTPTCPRPEPHVSEMSPTQKPLTTSASLRRI